MHNPQIKRVLFATENTSAAVGFASSLQSVFGVEVLCAPSLSDDFHDAGIATRAADFSKSAESILCGIDLLVVDLPDFDDLVLSGANFPKCVQGIDLDRIALMRAAAKRFAEVAVVCDPDAYEGLLQELSDNAGATLYETRIRNAYEAFQATSDYDYDVASWLASKLGIG